MNSSHYTLFAKVVRKQKKVITGALVLVALLTLMPFAVLSQQTDDPLIGTWKNSYGSQLDIQSHDSIKGSFYGLYSSSTGATGKYNIIGVSPPVSTRKNTNAPQPIALSILWKPIEGASGSPDEEWTSSMTGQIVMDTSGVWIMEVFHSLNASTPLPAVEIQDAGHYSETLTFKRVSSHSTSTPLSQSNMPPVPVENPLQGNWIGESSAIYPYLKIDLTSFSKTGLTLNKLGEFTGYITQKGVGNITLSGYTTPVAPTGNVQSLSFVFIGQDAYSDVCYSANGFLYEGERLELIINKSRAAPYSSKYTAVQITEKAIFYRGPSQKSINIAMQRNNFTNNGASEWTANFSVGNAVPSAPVLKFGIDTGGNFSWLNTTQCTTESCTGHGHVQFNPATSSTFQWIDKTPKVINWGPWGKAMANLGSDYISFNTDYKALRYNVKMITHFKMREDSKGQTGQLELVADQYVQLIEDGEHKGEQRKRSYFERADSTCPIKMATTTKLIKQS